MTKLIQPQLSTFKAFPESDVFADGIITLAADHDDRTSKTHLGIEYAKKSGHPLHMHIIEPNQPEGEHKTFPVILFIQGSAWFQQDLASNLAQLSRFARRGYVVAIVEYRPSTVAPFPAQIKDTKTAVRFMQAHAETYHADPENIILWGNSSGGHTAVMAGITLVDQTFDDEPLQDNPISIKAIVDYYGPTDISKMNEEPSTMDHTAPDSPEGMLIGGVNVLDNIDKVQPTVPMNHLSLEKNIPPILIMHGNKDRLVPFGQSVLLFNALKKLNKTVECYQLKGADHGGPPFWTNQVLDIVEAFIQKHLDQSV